MGFVVPGKAIKTFEPGVFAAFIKSQMRAVYIPTPLSIVNYGVRPPRSPVRLPPSFPSSRRVACLRRQDDEFGAGFHHQASSQGAHGLPRYLYHGSRVGYTTAVNKMAVTWASNARWKCGHSGAFNILGRRALWDSRAAIVSALCRRCLIHLIQACASSVVVHGVSRSSFGLLMCFALTRLDS